MTPARLQANTKTTPTVSNGCNSAAKFSKQLMRKYGTDLAQVITYREQTRQRLEELKTHDDVVAQIEEQRRLTQKKLDEESGKVRDKRKKSHPSSQKSVENRLHDLALPNARFRISVADEGAGDTVTFELGPNPGHAVATGCESCIRRRTRPARCLL